MSEMDFLRADLIDVLGTGMQYNPEMQMDLDVAMDGSDDEVIDLAIKYGLIEKNDEINQGRGY